jgi:hypothetical protein
MSQLKERVAAEVLRLAAKRDSTDQR